YGASLAAVAVGMAGKDYRDQPDVRAKAAALKKYLRTQSANQPLHHRAVALWASSRWPDLLPEQDRKKLVGELLSTQEADGGWSLARLGQKESGKSTWKAHAHYPQGAASDGYATGLAVLALRGGGVPAEDPKLAKGLAWLASRQ